MPAHAPDARDDRPSSGPGDNPEGRATQSFLVPVFEANLEYNGTPVWGNVFTDGRLLIEKLSFLATGKRVIIKGNNILADVLALQGWEPLAEVPLASHQSVTSRGMSDVGGLSETLEFKTGQILHLHAIKAERHVDEINGAINYFGELSITCKEFRSLEYTYYQRDAKPKNTSHVFRR